MRIPSMSISHGVGLDMDTELHRIESEAYCGVLRALTAQGGPTWDHIDTLLGLRKEFRISDVEHKEFVAKAESDDSVIMIRQWRERATGEKELPPKNINPPPVSSLSQGSSKRLKIPHVPVSSFSNYLSDAQPLLGAIPSSLATHFSSQCGGEAALLSSRESVVQPKKSVSHNRQASIATKGMIIQSKKGQFSHIDNMKKRLDTIEIHATNKLIQEVERLIYCGKHPDILQVEKAKSLLKEQERAITEALEKLADFSDDEDCRNHYDEQQRNGHQLATPYALYEQIDMTKSYYYNALNVGHANGGGDIFSQTGRYLQTP